MLNNSLLRCLTMRAQPITIVFEYLTVPKNELYIIFDLNTIFMLILFRDIFYKNDIL